MSRSARRALTAAVAAALPAAALALVAAPPAHAAGGAFPAHYSAPYLEIDSTTAGDLAADLSASGDKFYTLAFLTPKSGCTPMWERGNDPVGAFKSQIGSLQSAGGNVIISFGGAAGGELAQTCTSVSSLTAAYANVVNTYGVTRLDFDIEGSVLDDTASNARRDQALAALQAQNPNVQIDFTLPVDPSGLPSNAMNMLKDAKSKGVKVNLVNIMTMDFGDGENALNDAESAANGTAPQLASLYGITSAQAFNRMGLTPIAGKNDDNEVFSQANAQTLETFAASKGVQELSFWEVDGYDKALNYAYSKIFQKITGGTAANDFSVAVAPASGSVKPGSSVTASVSTAVTSGAAESVALSASGLPSGASASFSPASVTSGGGSTLTIATGASTPAGTYTVTVTGTAATGSHSATYGLTVTTGSTANDFSVSLSPASGTVTAGTTGSTTVSTAVTSGAAESVSLSASGLPSGASASFSPASVTSGGGSTLTIATGASTPAGTYSVTVTGTAATGSHSATYSLTVTAASGGTCNPAWSATASYAPGDKVSYGGHNYTSLYWSTNVTPGTPIAWNIWQDDGTC